MAKPFFRLRMKMAEQDVTQQELGRRIGDRAQRVLCERGPYRKRRMGQPGYSQSRQGFEYPER